MMTRREFYALADALGRADDLEQAVENVAQVCGANNSRFIHDRFMQAVEAASKARQN